MKKPAEAGFQAVAADGYMRPISSLSLIHI